MHRLTLSEPDVETASRAVEGFQGFEEHLAIGLVEALGYLNARTRHRYTGVYRFEPPMLRCVALFDRENAALRSGCDVEMAETYCSIVGARGAPFATADAAQEEELVQHPARLSVLSYCGVPLFAPTGACIGTLCHFDDRPRLVPLGEMPLLDEAARAIAAHLAAHGLDG